MPTLGRVKTWVEIDGKPLEEYAERVIHREPGVVCHIASEAGKQFAICLSHDIKLMGATRVVAKVYIDGVQTNYLILEPEGVTRCEGTLIQHNLQRQFQFAVLPRSPDANRHSSVDRAANIGNIHVSVRLAKVEVLPGPENFQPQIKEEPMRPVHVGVKKGSEHYTEFGPEVETQMTYGPVYIYPIAKYPPIIFKYLYAPKDIWKMRSVIPWNDSMPSPPLSSSSLDLVDLENADYSSSMETIRASTILRALPPSPPTLPLLDVPPAPGPHKTRFSRSLGDEEEDTSLTLPISSSSTTKTEFSQMSASDIPLLSPPPRPMRTRTDSTEIQTFPTTPTSAGIFSPVDIMRRNWDTESSRCAYPILMGETKEVLSPRLPVPSVVGKDLPMTPSTGSAGVESFQFPLPPMARRVMRRRSDSLGLVEEKKWVEGPYSALPLEGKGLDNAFETASADVPKKLPVEPTKMNTATRKIPSHNLARASSAQAVMSTPSNSYPSKDITATSTPLAPSSTPFSHSSPPSFTDSIAPPTFFNDGNAPRRTPPKIITTPDHHRSGSSPQPVSSHYRRPDTAPEKPSSSALSLNNMRSMTPPAMSSQQSYTRSRAKTTSSSSPPNKRRALPIPPHPPPPGEVPMTPTPSIARPKKRNRSPPGMIFSPKGNFLDFQ